MENTKTEKNQDTITGNQELTVDEKLENLARNVFFLLNQQKDLSRAVDNVYIQVCTLIELLAKKDIINEELWEETLKEVTQNIREQIERLIDDQKKDVGTDIKTDTDRTDEKTGSGKIITPHSGLIIPGGL